MSVLETEGRVASRSETENAFVPVMYRQHALSADRSHIATPIIATRTLRSEIFAQGPRPLLITICLVHIRIHRAAASGFVAQEFRPGRRAWRHRHRGPWAVGTSPSAP